MRNNLLVLFFTCILGSWLPQKTCFAQETNASQSLRINEMEYLEMPGLNVMLAHDYYPGGHQSGISIIQNGLRVGSNGDIRLEPTPGPGHAQPKVGKRMVDRENQIISVRMEYPDPDKNRKGFGPLIYPILNFSYEVKIQPVGKAFRVMVDLDKPLPDEWIGKVGFIFELFPGNLFGKSYYLDEHFGIFPRQANGPGKRNKEGIFEIAPLATGKKLTVAPETERQRMTIENVKGAELQLIDGRALSQSGWFIVRSIIPKGATKNAVEWLITPNALPNYKYDPVVQVSQVGYHPKQQKVAMIELDRTDTRRLPITLFRVAENGGLEKVLEEQPKDWGNFLRYHYLQFDFSRIEKPGMYQVQYGDYRTEPFQINPEVFQRHVWQPVLEYFLPVQMCHMRINDRSRVWHGLCHMDDARMAPINHNHFDGYIQGPSTLTKYQPGEMVPGLNIGGWHDAGDYDMRVESQATEVLIMSLAYEQFRVNYDNTSINQNTRMVEILQPDGKNDLLQQIEHGVLSVVGGYKSLGRLYRGIIEPTRRQYSHLGDAATMTDNKPYPGKGVGLTFMELHTNNRVVNGTSIVSGEPNAPDDRWVFTEDNPARELEAAAGMAAASRVLKGYNDELARESLQLAQELWDKTKEKNPMQRVQLAVELLVATGDKKYSTFLTNNTAEIAKNIERTGWIVGRSLPLIKDKKYHNTIIAAVKTHRAKVDQQEKKTPYGMPYEPDIWGAGWGIQEFGVQQYFLHTSFPDIFPATYMLHAMNFVLGVHPGVNTSSFASGVGSRSLTVAYGVNRDDWS
ncbi:MAG: glycoside hydrolase family 9 protein [Bacteroidota bacterium]|nr:glycoside hydrolase family 9 protein [Bacteroidota bacterium]